MKNEKSGKIQEYSSPAGNAALIAVMMVLDSLFFIWAKVLLPYISPRTSVFYIMVISALEIGLIAWLQKKLTIRTFIRNWWFFLSIGIMVAASTYLSYEAVAFIDPGTASMLNQFSIVFGLLWGLFWLREKFTRKQMVGAMIAVAGVITITFQQGDYIRLGSFMVLGATFMYSFHAALVKRYGGHLYFFEFFFYRLLSTGIFIFFFSLSSGSLEWPSPRAWPWLILVATLDIAIGRSLYYIALRRLKISYFSILLTLSPLLTVLWSLLLFDVVPTYLQLIGGIGVIVGVVVVSLNNRADKSIAVNQN